jgi:hypothetical protein
LLVKPGAAAADAQSIFTDSDYGLRVLAALGAGNDGAIIDMPLRPVKSAIVAAL